MQSFVINREGVEKTSVSTWGERATSSTRAKFGKQKKHEEKVGMRYNLEWEITLCTASLTGLSVAFSDSCRMFSFQPESGFGLLFRLHGMAEKSV
jgi:hypothetical protein